MMAKFVYIYNDSGSTDYLLGGSLVMKDGRIGKMLFDGGYAKATAISPTTYGFEFFYYNRDHLGNNRDVVNGSGSVRQVTRSTSGRLLPKGRKNYYPFGTPYADPAAVMGAVVQPYKYNGKELDLMHGLDTYDYGARQYDPVLARWDRMDPLCEKYYSVSPYAYCAGNPVNAIDPDGRYITYQNGNKSYIYYKGDFYENKRKKDGNGNWNITGAKVKPSFDHMSRTLNAFYRCKGLSEVVLPQSLQSIGESALAQTAINSLN